MDAEIVAHCGIWPGWEYRLIRLGNGRHVIEAWREGKLEHRHTVPHWRVKAVLWELKAVASGPYGG